MMPWCSWRRAHLRSWASRWPAMTQQAMHRMIRDALSSTIFLARTLMHPPRPSRVLSGRRVWTAIRTGAVNVVVLVKDADMRKFRLKTLEVFPPVWEVCSRTRSLEIPLRRLNLRQKPVAALYFVLVRSHTHTLSAQICRFILYGFLYAFFICSIFFANTLQQTLPSLKRCVCTAGSCGGQGALLSCLSTACYCACHHAHVPLCFIIFS